MNKKMLFVLLILALVAIILVFNSMGSGREIKVDLVVGQIEAIKSLVFLAFVAVGVAIGVLLK